MGATCLTPIGDGSADLCWFCAHDATVHADEFVFGVLRPSCTCKREDIYPAALIAEMDAAVAANRVKLRAELGMPPEDETVVVDVPLYNEPPKHMGRHSERRVEMKRERIARIQLHRAGKHAAEN